MKSPSTVKYYVQAVCVWGGGGEGGNSSGQSRARRQPVVRGGKDLRKRYLNVSNSADLC